MPARNITWHRSVGSAAVAAGVLAVGLYAVTLWGGHVYDDRFIVRDDPRVYEPWEWLDYLWVAYFPAAPDPLWRPLVSLSYALQWRIHGELAWPLHLVNILLHAEVSALVAVLGHRLTRSVLVAYLAGLLFAAHPVHVEAVAYVVGRAETLSALGVVGGLILFSAGPLTIGRAVAILGCFLLAVLSKEHGLMLAPMLLAWWAVRRWSTASDDAVAADPSPANGQERTALMWLFFLLSMSILAYIAFRESNMPLLWERFFLRWTANPVARAEGLDRMLLPIEIIGRYVALLVFPLRLSPDYGANVTSYRVDWGSLYVYLGFTTLAVYVTALFVAWRRRAREVLVMLLCLGISYLLISNGPYLIGIVMGERLIYLSSVFVIILAAMGLARLPRRVLVAVAAVVLVLASVRTTSYAWRWNDELRLYSYARQRHPASVQLHFLEAYVRWERGEVEEAERILEIGRRIGPESQNIWALSGMVAEQLGREEEAALFYYRAWELDQYPPHMPRD